MPRFRRRNSRYARKRVSRRKPVRAYGRKRTKRTSRPRLNKKRMLNVTSMKKRDTMMSITNTNANGTGNVSDIAGPAYVRGVDHAIFLFSPTARLPSLKSGPSGSMINQATRTSTTCFMRGFGESLKIQTSSSIPWFHRRIAFACKDNTFRVYSASDTPLNTTLNYKQNATRGYTRTWINQNVNNSLSTTGAWYAQLFKGSEGVDWDNLSTAPVDTRRVDLKYDKVTVIKSNNERGTVVNRKYWHPMNKNIVYDDDEIADVTDPSVWSVDDKRGMGDFHIMDMFIAGTGSVIGDLLKIDSTSTLYWR
ncbi:capsid protein [Marmot associated genomovirus 1]|nr:capsid protein [Marmot associated genomovirus 1]